MEGRPTGIVGRATSVERLVTQGHRGQKSPVEEVSLHLEVRPVGYRTPNREPCTMARLHSQKKFPSGRIWKTPAAIDGPEGLMNQYSLAVRGTL